MTTDPACGMEVDPLRSRVATEYDGELYYFCSEGCRTKFETNPAKFAESMTPSLDEQAGIKTPRLRSASTGGSFELHSESDRIEVGDYVLLTKTVTDQDVESFAIATSDTNALHLNDQFASRTRFKGRIVHGTLIAGLISGALASFPGITIYLSQSLEFLRPVRIGETVTAHCTVDEHLSEDRYRLTTQVQNSDGKTVIDGTATVIIDELPFN